METFESFIIMLIGGYLIRFSLIYSGQAWAKTYAQTVSFFILPIITYVITKVIYGNIALSLGMIGALSIVRFRAAIKEPEELVFLFLVIATGLGCGAGQIKITSIGILFSLAAIFAYSQFYKKNKLKHSEICNLAVIKNKSMKEKEIDELIVEMKKYVNQIELISFSKSKDNTTINFDLKTKDFSKLNKLVDKVQKKDIKVVVARNDLTAL